MAAERIRLGNHLRRQQVRVGSTRSMIKVQHNNLRDFTPIVLLSALLFISCAQLPVVEEAAETEAAVQPEGDMQAAVESMPRQVPQVEETTQNEARLASEAIPIMETVPEDLAPAGMDSIPRETEREVAEAGHGVLLDEQIQREQRVHQGNVEYLCEEIGNKLGSVSVEDCLLQQLQYAGAYSVNERPLTQRDFEPRNTDRNPSRVLIMGGIHGDEYSSISIMFKWMELLAQSGGNSYSWRFLPTVNPDGLLEGQAVRQNASGVDLNRNFPSQDWLDKAHEYWQNNTGQNPRRYPGVAPASEPEIRWIIEQIEQYQPEVIVSVHAPYHLLDFDGPSEAPEKIGDLYLHQLGVYPGSLGNYAGLDLGIPVVTLELPSAGIMPSDEQIETMWIDMLSWLNARSRLNRSAASR